MVKTRETQKNVLLFTYYSISSAFSEVEVSVVELLVLVLVFELGLVVFVLLVDVFVPPEVFVVLFVTEFVLLVLFEVVLFLLVFVVLVVFVFVDVFVLFVALFVTVLFSGISFFFIWKSSLQKQKRDTQKACLFFGGVGGIRTLEPC